MKTLLYIALFAILSFSTGYFLSQWLLVAFIGFVVALLFKQGILKSGLLTLLVVGLVWFGLAYSIDLANESILSTRIGNLFGGLGPITLAAVSGLIGGVVAMFGAFTGASLQSMINK
ncbi:MAG: hypothetical protein P8M34_12130 [Saprospiraceae bacterium]|nr:hypothetical protein [Saprospiraceae bacterium]